MQETAPEHVTFNYDNIASFFAACILVHCFFLEQSSRTIDTVAAPGCCHYCCSFTLATLPTALGSTADIVMKSINAAGLTKFYVNLMVMDYGDAACTKNAATGKCDMGQSAIDAANMLNSKYGKWSTDLPKSCLASAQQYTCVNAP